MIESTKDDPACEDMDRVIPLLYPLNKSLAEEVERLFSKWTFSLETPYYRAVEDDVMTEFRLNGQDSEYCPEFMLTDKSVCMSTLLESKKMINSGTECTTSTAMTIRTKKRTKKQTQECVFCKNNGEQENYYKQHTLKDSLGRVVCPILRAYTCPICNAKGDAAHTIKYCPQNNNPQEVAIMTTLKAHRTSTGHRRNKGILLPKQLRDSLTSCLSIESQISNIFHVPFPIIL